jgi:hypothetical protein
MVEDVKKLRVVPEMEALVQLEILEEGEIETALERPAENVAAAGPIAIFESITRTSIRVARRNAVSPRSEWSWGSERPGIQHGFSRVDSSGSLRIGIHLLGTHATDGDNGIGDEVLSAPENAADASGEIDHAIWLAALQHRDSAEAPAVDHAFHKRRGVGERRKSVLITDSEDVGAVKVSVSICRSGAEGIVPVKEEAEGALLIKSMRPGVGAGDEKAMAKALGDTRLQGVIIRYSLRFIEVGVGLVADERNAEINIALRETGDDRTETLGGDARSVVSIGKVLLINASFECRVLWRGDSCLVERNWHHQVNAVIADVGDVDQESVVGLPL